jgi:nitrogen regulatory protein P-II 1
VTKLEVIIRPSSLEKVEGLLSHPWIGGITVSQVMGSGRQRGPVEVYRGAEHRQDYLPRLKIELVIPDPLVPRITEDLSRLLKSGRIADGMLFIVPVDEAVRIRTGELGESAL